LVAAWTLLVTVLPAAASAQSSASRPGPEIDIDAAVISGGSFGTAAAELATGSGGPPLTLFTASYSSGASAGLDVRFSVPVSSRFRAEASGGWSRAEYRSQLGGDFEGADPVMAAANVSLFSLEGGGLWYFSSRGTLQPFVRGSAGWLRGLTSDAVLSGDGFVASGGAGVKYWWHLHDRAAVKRWGIRAEAGLVSRSAALPFGSGRRQLVASVVGGLAIGF
jgi:hypothetical protein